MTYWISRVDPSMCGQGAWWQQILPANVRLAILSLGMQRLVDEQLERAHEMILEKVERLDREEMDVINVGGSPSLAFADGPGHDRLLADIGRITKRPSSRRSRLSWKGWPPSEAGGLQWEPRICGCRRRSESRR